jgi:hypothetical protein
MNRRLFTFPRLIAVVLVIWLLAAIGLVISKSLDPPRHKLSSYLSWQIPETVSIADHKFFIFEKHPSWYWSLSGQRNELDELVNMGFRSGDRDELVATQRDLADVFQNTFTASDSDRVYYNEINRRRIVLLLKSSGTNAFVAIYSP